MLLALNSSWSASRKLKLAVAHHVGRRRVIAAPHRTVAAHQKRTGERVVGGAVRVYGNMEVALNLFVLAHLYFRPLAVVQEIGDFLFQRVEDFALRVRDLLPVDDNFGLQLLRLRWHSQYEQNGEKSYESITSHSEVWLTNLQSRVPRLSLGAVAAAFLPAA